MYLFLLGSREHFNHDSECFVLRVYVEHKSKVTVPCPCVFYMVRGDVKSNILVYSHEIKFKLVVCFLIIVNT